MAVETKITIAIGLGGTVHSDRSGSYLRDATPNATNTVANKINTKQNRVRPVQSDRSY